MNREDSWHLQKREQRGAQCGKLIDRIMNATASAENCETLPSRLTVRKPAS